MENPIFKEKRIGWYGQKPIGKGQFIEWMAQIEKRVERLEKAVGEQPRKQLKLKVK